MDNRGRIGDVMRIFGKLKVQHKLDNQRVEDPTQSQNAQEKAKNTMHSFD